MDFAITGSGDLHVTTAAPLSQLKVRFRHSEFPGLQVRLFIAGSQPSGPRGQLAVSFKTQNAAGRQSSLSILEADEELIQQIKIALQTEHGELPGSPTVGSLLSPLRHLPLRDEAVLRQLEAAAAVAIADLVPDAFIIARPELGDGFLYCRHINLYIYRNEKLLTTVSLY